MPITENSNVKPANPYGMSKLLVEHAWKNNWGQRWLFIRCISLLNAVNNDVDSRVSDYRWREKENLVPCIWNMQSVKLMKSRSLELSTTLWWNLYSRLHSCIRHYECPLNRTRKRSDIQRIAGTGNSVMEVIGAMNSVTGGLVKDVVIAPARKGDVPFLVASTTKNWNWLDSYLRYRWDCTIRMEECKKYWHIRKLY